MGVETSSGLARRGSSNEGEQHISLCDHENAAAAVGREQIEEELSSEAAVAIHNAAIATGTNECVRWWICAAVEQGAVLFRRNNNNKNKLRCSMKGIVCRSALLLAVLTLLQYGGTIALQHHRDQQRIPLGVQQLGRGPRSSNPNYSAPDSAAAAAIKKSAVLYSRGVTKAHFPTTKETTDAMNKKSAELGKVFNDENRTITLADLEDLVDIPDLNDTRPELSWAEAAVDRGPILDILRRAGLTVDVHVLQRLPTWSQVVRLYGPHPVVLVSGGTGLQQPRLPQQHPRPPPKLVSSTAASSEQQCAAFRDRVPAASRFVGVAGQMNTGTNALARYLEQNVQLVDNTVSRGVLWTVPWYKHGWANLRFRYQYRIPDAHASVMAVVLIRDPYFWMQR